jgi:hypothetical protein
MRRRLDFQQFINPRGVVAHISLFLVVSKKSSMLSERVLLAKITEFDFQTRTAASAIWFVLSKPY